MALNDRQQRFIDEYLIDLNATQAAIRAGYSKKTAYSMGQRLLKHVEVQAAVSEAQEKRAKRTEINQDRVLQELAKIGFSDLRNIVTSDGQLVSVQEWDDETAGAVASVEIVQRLSGEYDDGKPVMENVHKIRTWDKVAALDKLARHLGMYEADNRSKVEVVPFDGFSITRAEKPD